MVSQHSRPQCKHSPWKMQSGGPPRLVFFCETHWLIVCRIIIWYHTQLVYIVCVPEYKARHVLDVSVVLMHPSSPDHVVMSCVEIQNAMFILGHSVRELVLYIHHVLFEDTVQIHWFGFSFQTFLLLLPLL